jgi:hypothetical protein
VADYKKPRITELVDELPPNPNGKVGKRMPRVAIPGRSLVIVAARDRGMVGRPVVATEMTQTDRRGNLSCPNMCVPVGR